MQQVLFRIPVPWSEEGIPIYGFGMMLFLTFVLCTWFASRQAKKRGIPPEKIQDLAIVLFVSGIIGARIVYMIQYGRPWWEFFKIWEGGIVFYGSALGGILGYIIFYRLVLRRFNVSTWQLADIVAPTIALGLAIGRLGCFLNGCCYGHAVGAECPLPEVAQARFPLLTSPAQEVLVDQQHLQTIAGFSIPLGPPDPADPRTLVAAVEPDSNADRAGLQPGDRIVAVNGQVNTVILEGAASADVRQTLEKRLSDDEIQLLPSGEPERGRVQILFSDPELYQTWRPKVQKILPQMGVYDYFSDLMLDWPRGEQALQLTIERDGQPVELPAFVPRTLPLFPTQLFETISMLLLFFLLLAYYPFRRHDGQLMVLLMIGYALHRFVNEQLRTDTDPVAFGLTLSQNGSIVVLLGAIILELVLRRYSPRRTKGSDPSTIPPPVPATTSA